eukprot:GHVO01034078.1.p1 GENE.GHVO01034078.1~~GHVO01034078.1.p1  ORF type:complete len:456 (-),score=35.89 GHVO01034078.1:529-1896(-)
MMKWPIVAFAILVLAVIDARRCPSGTISHRNNYSERRCCRPKTCPAGTQFEICENTGEEAQCPPCPQGSFQSVQHESVRGKLCQIKRACDDGQAVNYEGDGTEERICECNIEEGFYNKSAGHPCLRRECPAGMELSYQGECLPCKAGTFKSEKGFKQCIEKKSCDLAYVSHGNVTHDTVCKEAEEADSQKSVVTDDPKMRESNDGIDSENLSSNWVILTVFGVIAFLILALIVGLTSCYCMRQRSRRRPTYEHGEVKVMLPASETSTPEPSNEPSHNVIKGEFSASNAGSDRSIGFSSMTDDSQPEFPDDGLDTASVVDNMPILDGDTQNTKRKHLQSTSHHSHDSGMNSLDSPHSLEMDCVPSIEDETLPKSSADDSVSVSPSDLTEPNGSRPKTIKVNNPQPCQPNVHIGNAQNCTFFIVTGDSNTVHNNELVASTNLADSENEDHQYEVMEV